MDRISALMDGELEDREAERELERLRQDPSLRDTWDLFHMIGDTVRGDCPLSGSFNHRLAASLEREPTILAPSRRRATNKRLVAYALSAAASVSAVAMVAWVAISTGGVGTPPEIAVAPAAVPAESVTIAVPVATAPQIASVPDDGGMSEYLLAHQGFSPSTALQGVAPYIRSVSARQGEVIR